MSKCASASVSARALSREIYSDATGQDEEAFGWRDEDGYGFADPGNGSALRQTHGDRCPSCNKKVGERDSFCKHCGYTLNPRIYPCPECGEKNRLTYIDTQRHYCCNTCANQHERGGY